MQKKMTNIVELRPDKKLINSQFEKYQFCTDGIPITSEIGLEKEIFRLEPNCNQESWLEARLFAFHNHLFKNPYDASCWFIDKDWIVWRLNKVAVLERVHTLQASNNDPSNNVYNPSIGFTSNNIIVICNGDKHLEILIRDTPRDMRKFLLNEIAPSIILDVQYVKSRSEIIVTMCDIITNGEKKCTRLTLLTYMWENPGSTEEAIKFVRKQNLKVKGTVEYARIEENGNHLHSICQDSMIFENSHIKVEKETSSNSVEKEEIKIPKYCWSQNEDSITVWIKMEKELYKEARINVGPNEINIIVDGNALIQGECQHRLDESLTTWKYEHGALQLDLMKFENGLMWSELIKGDTGGECLPNQALAAEIHSRLAHLCTDQPNSQREGQPCIGFNAEQLEECDLEARDNLLQRVNLTTQVTTHLSMLGTNNHVLFTYKNEAGQAICLRHDHDGCVWETRDTNEDEWCIKHTCNFPGFGYVEASKSNKKFCVSPPDHSYVAILEHTRHIFLYEKPKLNTKIGKQWIVDLGYQMHPVMGVVATDKYLIILTKNKLYRLQIHS